MEEFSLKFDEKNCFNSTILQQYDNDGQIDFVYYLMKNAEWRIADNCIVFPEINKKEQIEKLLKQCNQNSIRESLKQQKIALESANIIGTDNCLKNINSRLEQIERKHKKFER